MKRIVVLILLVAIAGIAGMVVRSKGGTAAELRGLITHNNQSDVREEIRKDFELAPGARVELTGLNGRVRIETSETTKAEVYVERTAPSQEALNRRKVSVEGDANSLRIRADKADNGFFSRLFGSSGGERVTLKVPRRIALYAKGVNGQFVAGEIDGPVEVAGINGKVQIANSVGRASFSGINGSIVVGLKRIDQDGVTLNGINGNIELQLGADVNANLDARGLNGRVVSDLPNVEVDKTKRGKYWARIGTGGNEITAKGINGNIRLTRGAASGAGSEAGQE
jgi:hypothetical protein